MSKFLSLKPARPGLIVRDPQTLAALPDAGADVADTPYWRRRLKDGDVEQKPRPTAKKKD